MRKPTGLAWPCQVGAACAALVATGGFLVAPAAAADDPGHWAMDADAGKVISDAGSSTITLRGPWSEVRGQQGRAIRFDGGDAGGQRAIGTADSGTAFNPGTEPFTVAVTLKSESVPSTGGYSPNVIQKGLHDSAGQWKMQLVAKGRLTLAGCQFKGGTGWGNVVDARAKQLADGRWHEVACWRTRDNYGVTVDGVSTAVRGRLGGIANGHPLTIGAKSGDADITDQFQGILDCAVFVTGANSRARALSQVPC